VLSNGRPYRDHLIRQRRLRFVRAAGRAVACSCSTWLTMPCPAHWSNMVAQRAIAVRHSRRLRRLYASAPGEMPALSVPKTPSIGFAIASETEHDCRVIATAFLFVGLLCHCFKSRRWLEAENPGAAASAQRPAAARRAAAYSPDAPHWQLQWSAQWWRASCIAVCSSASSELPKSTEPPYGKGGVVRPPYPD
jgi:hypothetical protein